MDDPIRITAFNWLQQQTDIYGDVLPRQHLENGFKYKGDRITLIGPKGIWKPSQMKTPLSITTIIGGRYKDLPTKEGFLLYKFRGTDPNHPDNTGLRYLMEQKIPLIYFLSIVKGKYLATWPVFIIQENRAELEFKVAVDDVSFIKKTDSPDLEEPESTYYRRNYITSTFRQRVHQRSFRERVLLAYADQCALCRLKHRELLDAAHIIPDTEESGDSVVQNGLSLCKIHHAAFDSNIIGITPDFIIRVREDVLHEIDGPMLKYGLQSLENSQLILPIRKKDWPDRERLEDRFERFLKAG